MDISLLSVTVMLICVYVNCKTSFHDKLVEYAEPLLYDLPKDLGPAVVKSIYTGGNFRCQGDSGTTHFALAFELPGGWVKDKDAMTLIVLQEWLGPLDCKRGMIRAKKLIKWLAMTIRNRGALPMKMGRWSRRRRGRL